MTRRIESHQIDGPAGVLEAMLEAPEDIEPRLAAVVCHPHPLFGGTMHNKVVYRIARGLRRSGIVVLRFNFRGVGHSQGVHGDLEGEIEDARAAVEWLHRRYPDISTALAGFSFGARVVARLGCQMGTPPWIMLAGFPTRHGATDFLTNCGVPKIFLQSTHDQYGPRAELESQFASFAGPKRLIWIEAEDHFFAGALDALEEQVQAAAQTPVVG